MSYEFFIDGIDLAEYLIEYPQTPNIKTNIGELVELQNLSFRLKNLDNSWTPDDPNFLLHPEGKEEPVIFKKDGIIIYTGLTRNAALSDRGRVATLNTTSKLNQILNAALPETILDQLTLSEISKELYLHYGVETDDRSYNRSKRKQELHAIQATTNVNLNQKTTMLQAQQFLANVGLCYHYFVNEVAYMEYYDIDTPVNPPTFTDDDILDLENYERIERPNYTGYSVNTAAGLAYEAGSNMAPVIEADQNQCFIINTLGAGFNIGDALIALSNRDQWKIKLRLTHSQWSESLDLTSFFKIQSTVTGIDQTFYCVFLDQGQPLEIIVEGLTV